MKRLKRLCVAQSHLANKPAKNWDRCNAWQNENEQHVFASPKSCSVTFFSVSRRWPLDTIELYQQPVPSFLNDLFFSFKATEKEESVPRGCEAADQRPVRPNSTGSRLIHPVAQQGRFSLVEPWLSDRAISDGAFTLTEPWMAPSCAAGIFTLSEA